MHITETGLPGVRLLHLPVHHDGRGYFLETWQSSRYCERLGVTAFVQHNQSFSGPGVLRGMHYQRRHGQGKLVRVVQGRVWDVAVDLRPGSPAFGCWTGVELSGIDPARPEHAHIQLWIPPGFAHGFQVLSAQAIVEYLCTDFYHADDEVCLRWNDPEVAIDWPGSSPVLSERDRQGHSLRELKSMGLLPEVAGRQGDGSGPLQGRGVL